MFCLFQCPVPCKNAHLRVWTLHDMRRTSYEVDEIPTPNLELTSDRPSKLYRDLASNHDKAQRALLVDSFN